MVGRRARRRRADRRDGPSRSSRSASPAHFDHAGSEATRYLQGTLPNGLAFARNGDILISNFGTDWLEMMSRDGASRVLADSIDGEPIGKVNFVLRDSRDRIWITVSTRIKNWMHALRTDLADGYLARYENGHVPHRRRRFPLHQRDPVRRQRRVPLRRRDDRRLHHPAADRRARQRRRSRDLRPARLGKGAWPDGIAFDSSGNLWGTLVLLGQAVRADAAGRHAGAARRRRSGEGRRPRAGVLHANTVTEEVLFATGRGMAPWMASVTFGGPDLRTVYIGSLKGTRIPYFRAPVAGLPMVHWNERAIPSDSGRPQRL